MKKIVILFLFLILCFSINVNGLTNTGTFTPLNNYGPQFSDETPSNNTIDVAVSPLLSIQANDTEGDLFNLTFSVYSDGSWVVIGTNNSANNGTYTCTNTSLIQEYSTTYQWKVSGIDARNAVNETIYQFTTIVTTQADFVYVIDGYRIICTSTSTGNIESYKWDIAVNGIDRGTTDWINDTSVSSHTFILQEGEDFRITLCVRFGVLEDCTSRTGHIYPKVEEPPEEIEPEVEKTKVRNIFEDTGISDWLKERNIGEFMFIGIIALFVLFVLFKKRQKKSVLYPIKKEVK